MRGECGGRGSSGHTGPWTRFWGWKSGLEEGGLAELLWPGSAQRGQLVWPSNAWHNMGWSHGGERKKKKKSFSTLTALILLCLPDGIQWSTSGLIKRHCTRLQRTRINRRRRRFPQPTRTFWSTEVGEEESTLSKMPGRQSSSAANRERSQRFRKRDDIPEAHSKQK